MTTETKNLTFLEVLRLKNAELWESKLNHFSMISRGDLQLLYHQATDVVLIRLHNFNWVLEKDLQIIGHRSVPKLYQAYTIASPGGFFCIKVPNLDFTQQRTELINFETVLNERASFIRNNLAETKIDQFFEEKKSGLGAITETIMNAVDTITHSLEHSEYSNHPNYQIVRPTKDLFDLDSKVVPVVDISENEITNFRTETSMLIRDYQGLGEWKSFWDGGNTPQFNQEFSQMNINQGQQVQGSQQLPVGSLSNNQDKPMGTTSERLPSYEVNQSSQKIHEGLTQASSNTQESTDSTQLKKDDSTEFTTGLLKGDIDLNKSSPGKTLND